MYDEFISESSSTVNALLLVRQKVSSVENVALRDLCLTSQSHEGCQLSVPKRICVRLPRCSLLFTIYFIAACCRLQICNLPTALLVSKSTRLSWCAVGRC